ncbi:hypothetical protein [Kiloniella sp.]
MFLRWAHTCGKIEGEVEINALDIRRELQELDVHELVDGEITEKY